MISCLTGHEVVFIATYLTDCYDELTVNFHDDE